MIKTEKNNCIHVLNLTEFNLMDLTLISLPGFHTDHRAVIFDISHFFSYFHDFFRQFVPNDSTSLFSFFALISAFKKYICSGVSGDPNYT